MMVAGRHQLYHHIMQCEVPQPGTWQVPDHDPQLATPICASQHQAGHMLLVGPQPLQEAICGCRLQAMHI